MGVIYSTGMLCSVEWQFLTNISGQPVSPIFHGQKIQTIEKSTTEN